MALRAVPEHPKFAHLQALLDLEKFQALGILETIWHFTGRFSPQGNIGKYSDEAIARWVGWKRDPSELINALADAKWLDRVEGFRLVTHDWHIHADHATRLSLKRAKLQFCMSTGPTPDLQPTITGPTPDEQGTEDGADVPPAEGLPGAGAGPEAGAGPKTKGVAPLIAPPVFVLPEWISKETWAAFEKHRKAIRKPMTDQARKNIVAKLIRLEAEGMQAEDVLNESITNGWSGVFTDGKRPTNGNNGNRNQQRTNGNIEALRRATGGRLEGGDHGFSGSAPSIGEHGNAKPLLALPM